MFHKFPADIVDVDDVTSDNEDDKIASDEEEEYHEADDEDSEAIVDEETNDQRLAHINVFADNPDKSTEYEIVPLNINGRGLPKKR